MQHVKPPRGLTDIGDRDMRINDYFELDEGAKVRTTADGYLVATPRVARTGIQLYYGSELGLTGDDAKKVMKVFRSEDEVFKTDSLATYGFKPVTDDHPPVKVDVKNWKDYGKGQVGGEVLRDQEFIRVPMALMDSGLANKVKSGKVEISVGYDCEIDMTPGTTPDGMAYDARQMNIAVNHVAIVDAARGGAKLRFGDATASAPPAQTIFTSSQDGSTQQKDEPTMKTIMIDGIPVEVATDVSAAIITKAIDTANVSITTLTKRATDAETALATVQKALDTKTAEATTILATKDAEIVTLKKQVEDAKLTPAQIDQLVKDRAIVAGKGRAIMGDKLVVDGKTDNEIMRQVVDAKLGDLAKGWSDDQYAVSFASITAGVKATDKVTDTSAVLAHSFSAPPQHDTNDLRAQADAAHEARTKRLEDAWKGAPATA
jgi:hypothetical protein